MDETIRYEGKWLRFCEREFENAHGEKKPWEYVTRRGTPGAVCIVAVRPGAHPTLVLVEQHRPPTGAAVLEFPAGLVEPGDRLEETALRELEEETGYRGRITGTYPAVYNSPGLTDEKVATVIVEVTGRAEVRPEPDEAIEVVELPLESLKQALDERARVGALIDAKLWYYAMGLETRRA
jgi:8-oxo-dGTP pyrophosphatase MutT (NUDIX family)